MKKWQKKVKETKPLRNRKYMAIVLYVVSILLFLSVFFRFTWIMVKGEVNGENLEQNVQRLYTRNTVLPAKRGTIYDRNGNPIALDATTYKMVAVLTDEWSTPNRPIHIEEANEVASVLAKHISMSEEELLDRLTRDNNQVEFGKAGNNLTYEVMSTIKEELEEKELTGITFEEKQSRFYPNGIFASHTIGLAQQNNDDDDEEVKDKKLEGILGLEKEFDDTLSGQNGWMKYQRDRFGYVIPGQEIEQQDPVDGQDIHLTIDRRLQIFLESIMSEVEEMHEPVAMTANLMNAKTGEILASSQRPTFNPITKEGIEQSWQNMLVEYAIEPGSTMKVMTLAAAIQEGTFRPYDYFKSGRIEVAGGLVRDVNRDGWGTITYLEGLARSSNVGFVHMIEEMGHDTWKTYLDDFGFGTRTGISLPNETTGSNPYEWPLQRINTGFGQGITVTPVQMLRAFSAIANGGKMVEPHLVSKLSNTATGGVQETKVNETETLITKETADKTLEYLKETVYSEEGNAKGFEIEGHITATKTGTAQIVDPETGKYIAGGSDYLYSVVGMAPLDDPELILYVTVQQPKLNGTFHGSQVVQKIYNPFMKRALEYVVNEGSSSAQTEIEGNKMENVVQEDTQSVIQQFTQEGKVFEVIGSGDTIVQQFPLPDSSVNDSYRIMLLTNGAMTLPDLTGWSRSDVLRLAELTGINVSFEGEGYVSEQSLPQNAYIETGMELFITLSPPQ